MTSDLVKFTKCDIFTPDDISKLMTSKLHKSGTLLEPSAGNGGLLRYITGDYNVDAYELKAEYLDQIQSHANKHNCDFIKAYITKRYDNIIMNPPYIKIQDLSAEYRKYLKTHFEVLKTGLVDIYYAFILKSLSLLQDDGILVAITPNSYLYNKSALGLRKYLFDNTYIQEIIDYKDKKVFPNASVYCCITIFTLSKKTEMIYNGNTISYSDIIKNYSLFNLSSNHNTLKDICKIRNGIATLRDKIYIHDTKLFDEPCWRPITTGHSNKYIIYPYNDGTIIKEETFKTDNPQTYAYLLTHKTELSNRDKGNKTYPMWYSYGRTQSIKYNDTLCVYIPCFLDPKCIEKNMFTHRNVLHYSCLCLEPNGVTPDVIIDCIVRNIKFINENSAKRSAGWINMSSRVLYDIPLN